MTTPPLTDQKALIFDVYGTLIDWETGLHSAAPLQPRTTFLQTYFDHESALQTANPTMLYSTLVSEVFSKLSLPAPPISSWPAFPDTVAALQVLKKHFKLIVLSNVDKASFATSLPRLGGDEVFDLVVTAEDVGAYKPDLKGFEWVLREVKERWGIEKEQVMSVANSLFHDHIPAKKLGLKGVWIRRPGAVMGVEGMDMTTKREWEYDTLGEMAEAVEREVLDGEN
jgi:2-haloalkanoic acid dehalogenase type II